MRNALRLLTMLFVLAAAGCGPEASSDDAYVEDMAEQHADDTPTATPMAAEPSVAVEADSVRYATVGGEPVTGYMAVPVRADSVLRARGGEAASALPAVLVIHEWWGLNDNIRRMTRRLAGEGYRALAVDLYRGQVAEGPEQARQYMQEATSNPEALTDNLTSAYEYLTDDHGAPAVASLGWCFGGSMSLRTALALPEELAAAVIYYGHIQEPSREELETLQMPILAFFGAEDGSIPVEDVRTFERTLDELGKDARVTVYDGAGHAFANPSGQNYVESAATDSWRQTVSFLQEHLW